MSKPANTVAIGAFVAGGLLILFSIAFYVGGAAFGKETARGLVIFDGSVKGLNVGASVAFKGVQIGEVTKIHLVIDTDTFEVLTPVEIRVTDDQMKKIGSNLDVDTLPHLIKRGLRAQLQTQSLLTGLLYIQLDFHPGSKLRFTKEDVNIEDDDVIIIPTIPTDMERLTRNLDKIDFGALIISLKNTIKGVEAFVNNPEMQALAGNMNQSLAAVSELSNRLKTEIDALSPGMNSLVENADVTVKQLNEDLPAITANANASMEELAAALASAQTTMANIDYLLSDDSAVIYDVRRAATELGAAGRALQSLAETLETQPESLLKGKSPLAK